MIEQTCLDNLIKLKDWLLENRKLVENHLDFADYCYGLGQKDVLPTDTKYIVDTSVRHSSKITCCPLGWAAYSQLFEIRGKENYYSFIKANFPNLNQLEHLYLFYSTHTNDFDNMIKRFNYIIDNGQAPLDFKVY
jgi:hypothetical protein